jgi:hypothetical protein
MARKKNPAEEPPGNPSPQEPTPAATTAVSEPSAEASPTPEAPPPEGNGSGPVQSFSVPVARDTFIQSSVWERTVPLKDNAQFVTHEVSFCKRWRNAQGEWKTLKSFRASELYALAYVLRRAEDWILNYRTTTKDCPF